MARLRAGVAVDLLQRLRDVDPGFFEQVVLDLLIAMLTAEASAPLTHERRFPPVELKEGAVRQRAG